jgi:hypothetical protein
MDYVANGTGAPIGWNLSQQTNPPGPNGPMIKHPADSAAGYIYFAMDGLSVSDRGGGDNGVFTTSLCGCVAGFLIRVRGGIIRRIAGYHQTGSQTVPKKAKALFFAAGTNGPSHGDIHYLLIPDKAGMFMDPPDPISDLIGREIPQRNMHRYRRSGGEHVSWVISFDGGMGEMTDAFAASRSPAQKEAFGQQRVIAPLPRR